jgi:PilZ domain
MLLMEDTTMTDPAPKKPNKRLSRRSPAKGTTRLRVYRNTTGLGPNIASLLLDLNETGLRAILKEAAAVGQQVEVNLDSAATGRALKATAKVVWVVPATDGTFVVGLRLQKAISYSDLQALTKL